MWTSLDINLLLRHTSLGMVWYPSHMASIILSSTKKPSKLQAFHPKKSRLLEPKRISGVWQGKSVWNKNSMTFWVQNVMFFSGCTHQQTKIIQQKPTSSMNKRDRIPCYRQLQCLHFAGPDARPGCHRPNVTMGASDTADGRNPAPVVM